MLGVPAADVGLVRGRRVGMLAVEDVKVIVAVELEHFEAKHETLQDRVGLERHDALEVPLVLRHHLGAFDLPVARQKAV